MRFKPSDSMAEQIFVLVLCRMVELKLYKQKQIVLCIVAAYVALFRKVKNHEFSVCR